MNHNHVLYDSDPHFTIDPISRKITNQSSRKTSVVQHDHNSERLTFECPRYVEGRDLSTCNIVEIHYLNIEANTKTVRAGVYTVDDLQVKDDDENAVVFSWVVPNNATQFVGQLQFLVRFACALEDTGTVDYVWNTGIYSSIGVAQGIYNSNSPSDNPLPAFNFVTTINGHVLKFFVGTKAEYNELPFNEREGLFALITDDTTRAELEASIDELNEKVDAMVDAERDAMVDEMVKYVQGVQDGDTIVPKAAQAHYTPDGRSLNELANRVDAVEDILTEEPPTVVEPTSGGSPWLVDKGYYYVELRKFTSVFGSNVIFPVGIIYWESGRDLLTMVEYCGNTYDVNIGSDGRFWVREYNHTTSKWDTVTDEFDIYVHKLGGGVNGICKR